MDKKKKKDKKDSLITEYDTALDKPDGMFLDSEEIIIEEAEVKNGEKHGDFFRRDENNTGAYFAQGTYKNGKLDGLYYESYSDELYTLELEVTFKNGRPDGAYMAKDKIKAEEEKGFFKNGKLDGLFMKYNIFSNKKKKLLEGRYNNGERDGIWQFFYEYNKQPLILEYENGNIKVEYLKILDKENEFFKKNFSMVLSDASIMEHILKKGNYSSSFKISDDNFIDDIFNEKCRFLHKMIDERKQIKFNYGNEDYEISPYCFYLTLEDKAVRCFGYDMKNNKWADFEVGDMENITEGDYEKEFNLEFEKKEKIFSDFEKYVVVNKATYEKVQEQRRLLLKVSLMSGRGKKYENIFKMILMPENYSLLDFARIILHSYNFNIDHRFGFYDNLEDKYKSKEGYEMFADVREESQFPGVKNAKIKDVFNFVGKRMLFFFDYGDNWKFSVEYLSDDVKKKHYPEILDSFGKPPSQY